ncbi:unnamed protein product [Musa banksii]
MPRTEDEIEKLVRVSPNCSFVWIKYTAYTPSLADIEKACSIAERALRTINISEEGEKLNIWVAYVNLENKYGSQPEEAVKKIFQRALQCCDPKKLYLALLGVYERNEQQDLADELLASMTKEFKHSCKEIRLGDEEVIHALFERATCLSLPPKKMKFLFTKYLNYEKAHGDEDRVEHVKWKALEYADTYTSYNLRAVNVEKVNRICDKAFLQVAAASSQM